MPLKDFAFILFVLTCLCQSGYAQAGTKSIAKRSSTNTAPLPAANRLATAHARVVRAVRARPPCGFNVSFRFQLMSMRIIRQLADMGKVCELNKLYSSAR